MRLIGFMGFAGLLMLNGLLRFAGLLIFRGLAGFSGLLIFKGLFGFAGFRGLIGFIGLFMFRGLIGFIGLLRSLKFVLPRFNCIEPPAARIRFAPEKSSLMRNRINSTTRIRRKIGTIRRNIIPSLASCRKNQSQILLSRENERQEINASSKNYRRR